MESSVSQAKPITILMAEDDPDDRLLTEEAFSEALLANDLRFVEDGEELMDYLYRRGKYADVSNSPHPGLILLDLNMPRKDGREVLSDIKNDDELKYIPVIVLTRSDAEQDVLKSYNLHANSYITKPVDFDQFVEAIRKFEEFWLAVVRLPANIHEL